MIQLNVMQKYNDDLQNQNPPKPRLLFTTVKYLLDTF